MPVEIRELQITTVVQESGRQAASEISPSGPGDHKEDIVAQVVEQVMQILNEKKER
jgi:hypothetical protein